MNDALRFRAIEIILETLIRELADARNGRDAWIEAFRQRALDRAMATARQDFRLAGHEERLSELRDIIATLVSRAGRL